MTNTGAIFGLALLAALCNAHGAQENDTTAVVIETSKGAIVLELFTARAPASAANFISYAESGFYDGTVFHRVIPDFVVQGGGLTADMQRKETGPGVVNEADNGLLNERGTVAIARTQDPHSATSQFFFNLSHNAFLNHTSKTARGWGYTVFARVVDGMDVVDRIADSPTTSGGGMRDVPIEPIVIESVRVADPPE